MCSQCSLNTGRSRALWWENYKIIKLRSEAKLYTWNSRILFSFQIICIGNPCTFHHNFLYSYSSVFITKFNIIVKRFTVNASLIKLKKWTRKLTDNHYSCYSTDLMISTNISTEINFVWKIVLLNVIGKMLGKVSRVVLWNLQLYIIKLTPMWLFRRIQYH